MGGDPPDPPYPPAPPASRRMTSRSTLWIAISALALAACSNEPGAPTGTTTGTVTTSETASTSLSTSTASTASTTSTTSTPSGTGGADAGAPLSLRVLFIGNSYTYVNDLPTWVHRLGDSSGVASVEVSSVTAGGATLAQQVSSTGAVDRIREAGWTHVVIQGQSVEPLLDPASFEAAAATLAAEAKKVGATPVFYETWARAPGDLVYSQPWSGGTPPAMQAGLRAGYQKVAAAAGGAVAPAGDAWEKTLADQPSLVIFQPDGSHPSIHGTYLVACVFHAKLTGKSPVGIADRPPEISAGDAATLQAEAAGVTLP